MKKCKNAFPYIYLLRGNKNHTPILPILHRIKRYITDSNYYNYSYIYDYYSILPLFYRVFDSSKLCIFDCIFYAHFYNFLKQLFNFSAIIRRGVQARLSNSAAAPAEFNLDELREAAGQCPIAWLSRKRDEFEEGSDWWRMCFEMIEFI